MPSMVPSTWAVVGKQVLAVLMEKTNTHSVRDTMTNSREDEARGTVRKPTLGARRYLKGEGGEGDIAS